jgi:hypothetical protein
MGFNVVLGNLSSKFSFILDWLCYIYIYIYIGHVTLRWLSGNDRDSNPDPIHI